MEPKQNLIDSLSGIRSTLRGSLNCANGLTMKLVGPGKEDGVAQMPTEENVSDMVAEISHLASRLARMLDDHHNFVGSFAPTPAQAGRNARA